MEDKATLSTDMANKVTGNHKWVTGNQAMDSRDTEAIRLSKGLARWAGMAVDTAVDTEAGMVNHREGEGVEWVQRVELRLD